MLENTYSTFIYYLQNILFLKEKKNYSLSRYKCANLQNY